MTDEQNGAAQAPHRHWFQARIVLFVGSSIVIAIIMVSVSMALYASSGAAQLDLSRPGFQAVQSQVEQSTSFKSFPATGDIDNKTIEQFKKLYEDQVKQVTAVDAFNPSVLDEQALGIGAPATTE